MNWFQEYAFRRLWENNGGTDRVMIKNSHMATRLNAIKQKNVLFITEFQCAFFSFIPQPRSQVWILKNRNLLIDRFLLRGQQLCKFVGTKEIKFFIRKEFNLLSTPTWPLFHCVDVKWKRSIDPDGISLIRSFKIKACSGNAQLDTWREGRCGGLGYAWNSYWLIRSHTAGFFKSKFRWCATRSWLSTVVVCRFTVYICILGLLQVIRNVGQFFLSMVMTLPLFLTLRFIWNKYGIKNTDIKIKSVSFN